ncbi:MAG TPA: CmpA/NrtA family ABC transporter substrate-binding protein [Candidatus Binatia bacterium]|nr:CmpA/NrtA family ABC transporter substrate-binding protein [Candidatus Binatia bacterium]
MQDELLEKTFTSKSGVVPAAEPVNSDATEERLDRAVEKAVIHAVFGHGLERREFLRHVGIATAAAILNSIFPMNAAKALAQEKAGPIEKKNLKVGFIPITCATPIIMAEPMGFYKKHELDVQVHKASGWAMIRDLSINGETDATHMLTPMPLAISMGAGSQTVPFVMPAVENINGQAITLHNKHKGVKEAKDMKGFKFCVPFDYSMHNFLLRYYLAEGGVDPDKDVQIRVVPPPEMVANLRAGNVDGYLAPDPFNQRAVFEGEGFIFMLSKEIWPGHPCCAFAVRKDFAEKNPNTFQALFKAIVDATNYAHDPSHRKEIAKAIAPRNFLNQPVELLEQVLTGVYPDGLGNTRNVPDRIDFDPFPYHSMAIWILTQMKRWGYIKQDVDYKKIAQEVYLASGCREIMKSLGYKAPAQDSVKHQFTFGRNKTFDPNAPADYIRSFPIRRA